MSNKKETFSSTLIFVFIICLVCAALVSFSAVSLKPMQKANKLLDQHTKILEASGLLAKAGNNIEGTYKKYISAKLIDLATGDFVKGNPDTFDERADSRDPSKSIKPKNDIAGINRRANHAVIYLVKDDSGKLTSVVLPIVGMGLWDIMYGYVGLEADLNTVKSVVYYELKETPGLGAEVMNPKWKALWKGKQMFDSSNKVAIKIVKGGAQPGDIHGVDALSGATLTSRGVEHTLLFWFGDEGYGPFIAKFRHGGLS